MQMFEKNDKVERLFNTEEMWRSIVERIEQSLLERLHGQALLKIRMVRIRFCLPIATEDSEVNQIDGSELITSPNAHEVLNVLAKKRYGLKQDKAFKPDTKMEISEKENSNASLLSTQLNITQVPKVDSKGPKNATTAKIWIVYDVIAKSEKQVRQHSGVVERVEVQSCELIYQSDVWRDMSGVGSQNSDASKNESQK